jgi:hypothetical protein
MDGDGTFEPCSGLVGESFDAATAFEDPMPVFDTPSVKPL